MDTLHLTWGMPHKLEFFTTDGGDVHAELHINKTNGTQTIHVDVPAHISLHAIQAAWERQHGKWIELFVYKGPPFVAIRVIWIDVDYCLVWHVIHNNDNPHDTLNFMRMNETHWPFGQITAASV